MARDSSKRAPKANTTMPGAIPGWLVAVLVLPRIARLLYPQVWVEDDFYLESIYLVSIGMRPYLDFVHVHMPLLEWFAAAYVRIFGASHFSIELLNEAAIYVTSILTWSLANRIAGRRAAICAAILYAFASLVFRYHVFERECFAGVAIVAATLIVLDDEYNAARRIAAIALLFIVACAIKLTSVIPGAVVLGYLAIGQRRWRDAMASGAAIAIGLIAFSAFLHWLYGFEFIFQTFIFHFMKGRDVQDNLAAYPGRILDVLAPLFVLGVVRFALERARPRGFWLVLGLVAANYVFFGFLSPTAWGHNYLDWIPFIAIVAGFGLERWLGAIGDLFDGRTYRGVSWGSGGAALIFFSLIAFTPLVNENWLRGSIYGFGFIDRDEIATLARAIRKASAPGDRIIAPAFLCFEANRRELIRYPETYGVWREAEAEYEHDGFFRARRMLGSEDFYGLIIRSAHYWGDQMNDAIAKGTVPVVIADSTFQMMAIARYPLANLSPDFLLDHGYFPALRTQHYVMWRRRAEAKHDQAGRR
jgi:Dolichyl-phosphate-mannose-protein mannosyltransferase